MRTVDTDVVIVGGGPVGLFSAFVCGTQGLSCCVIDIREALGGQCTALYPEKAIRNVPGFQPLLASTLIHNLEAQLSQYPVPTFLGEEVSSLQNSEGMWHVRAQSGKEWFGRSVLLTMGNGPFTPRRLEGARPFEGTSVFYAVSTKESFRNKRLLIVGGGDPAIDWCNELVPVAAHVTLVHRRDQFRAHPDGVARVREQAASGIMRLLTSCRVAELRGESGQISEAIVTDAQNASQSILVDSVLVFMGLEPKISPLEAWGIRTEKGRVVTVPQTGETNLAGVFAAGDGVSYPGKLGLLAVGFAEGMQAVHAIRHYLLKRTDLGYGHSVCGRNISGCY